MKKTIKIFLILFSIVILFFLVNFIYLLSMVGSYPYAEEYIVNLPEDEVIDKIVKLKEKDTSLKVDSSNVPFNWDFTDGKDGYWYFMYFQLKDGRTVLSCFVRNIDRYSTTIGLINVRTDPTSLKVKEINSRGLFFMLRDMSAKENRQFKKDFEEQILNKLGVEWKKERWWDNIF